MTVVEIWNMNVIGWIAGRASGKCAFENYGQKRETR